MENARHDEIWKPIKGYEGLYEISSYGRVKRLARYVNHFQGGLRLMKERIINQHISHDYLRVELTFNKKSVKKQVHVLVATAFISNPKKLPQVNHINGLKSFNYYKNLEWVNGRENQTHRFMNIKTSSKYAGVRFHKRRKTKVWQAGIGIGGKDIHLGYHETEEEAHEAYLQALKDHNLKNKYATVNT